MSQEAVPLQFTATREAEGGGRIEFQWSRPTAVDARINGRNLALVFSNPVETNLVELSDQLAALGGFVRVSADHKTLNLVLNQDMSVRAQTDGLRSVVLLVAGANSKNFPEGFDAENELAPAASSLSEVASAALNAPMEMTNPDGGSGVPILVDPILTISEGQNYTRLAFEWPQPVAYSAHMAEGELELTFKTEQTVRLTRLRVESPPRVRSATGVLDGDVFTVNIGVTSGTQLRHVSDANYVIIDLVDAGVSLDAEPDYQVQISPATNDHGGDDHHEPPTEEHGESHGEDHADSHGGEGQTGATDGHAEEAHSGSLQSVLDIDDIDLSILDERLHEENLEGAHDDAHMEELEESHATTEVEPELPPVAFAVGVEFEREAVHLSFPWGETVPAAVVRRGERLWMAFGRRGEIDLSELSRVRDEGLLTYKMYEAAGATIVGLQLAPYVLATAAATETGWTLTLGDAIIGSMPDITVTPKSFGDAEVSVAIASEAKIAYFKDPEVEDELIFVMVGSELQGTISARRFVDFELMATALGVVVRPIASGVEARAEPGRVIISRQGGLNISGTRVVALTATGTPDIVSDSPARLLFAEWKGPEDKPFSLAHKELLVEAAISTESLRLEAQLNLARFLLAHEMASEALGVLNVLALEVPTVEADVHFRTLRGVSNLLLDRVSDAKKDLNNRLGAGDPYVELWMGMLAAREENWPKARVAFQRAEPAINRLAMPWQARVRLAAAEASLVLNDVAAARTHLEIVPKEELGVIDAAFEEFLQGRLAEALGDTDVAQKAYNELAESIVEPIAVRASLAKARLAAKTGESTVDEAIDQLEAVRYQWRGDAIEANTLLELAQLYARLGDYRHALATMRMAVRHFPGTPVQRRVSAEMHTLFEDLFLDGLADEVPPIQALGLYYDYRELTPIGPKGDVMIRRLSDRLVAMDLLDQATELLKHQVDNRLRGVARSQVAARLALVQLMNRSPEDALRTILSTRQSRLPETIASQRRLIEARALLDLKRYDHALDIVSVDAGPVIDKLRADIHWRAEDWSKVGPAYERGLGDIWNEETTLSEVQRFEVMRCAIAYVLADDEASVERISRKFTPKMVDTPDMRAFQVVTGDSVENSLELYTLTERFSAVDTLEAFLGNLKAEWPEPSEAIN